MRSQLLEPALHAAIVAIAKLDSPAQALARVIGMTTAQNNPENAHPALVSLLATVRSVPELKIFDEQALPIAGGIYKHTYVALCNWLLKRAAHTSPTQAVSDVAQYLTTTSLHCTQVLVVSGTIPGAPFEIGAGIYAVPWEALPPTVTSQIFSVQFFRTSLLNSKSALLKDHHIPRTHLPLSDIPPAHRKTVYDTILRDALICIGLAGAPPMPDPLLSVTSFPESVPLHSASEHYDAHPFATPASAEQPQSTAIPRALFADFLRRSDAVQSRLRLAADRLRASSRRSFADAAIDIGIALEMLCLNDQADERGELTFRLKLRAARLLGQTPATRKAIFDKVGRLYKLRSAAVHTGTTTKGLSRHDLRTTLDDGFVIATETARHLISHGDPNWNDVQFS